MPAGFQVFNADGSLQFDTSYRLFRPVTTFTTTTTNGSKTIAGLSAAGEPVAMIVSNLSAGAPTISISGDTVSWTFNSTNTGNSAVAVIVLVH